MDRRKGRARRRAPEIDRRIESLVSESGLSRAVATQVALGRIELNDVLKKMALAAAVDSLIRKHSLSRALATQVALGQADLDAVLFKRRLADHFAGNAQRSALQDALDAGDELALALHGHRDIEARIAKLDRYEFFIEGSDEPIHKLQLKWCVGAAGKKKARRAMGWDKARKAEAQEPIWRPQDRYTCSNRRLFGYLDRETPVEVRLIEGEILKGRVAWAGRFEFGLVVKNKIEVTMFRHALVSLSEP
ncbi:MAG TPA: hypothetical protein QGF58_05265 [Myxococcota bacterium]|nr:hypothetical protein [Myxococcota bacterium]